DNFDQDPFIRTDESRVPGPTGSCACRQRAAWRAGADAVLAQAPAATLSRPPHFGGSLGSGGCTTAGSRTPGHGRSAALSDETSGKSGPVNSSRASRVAGATGAPTRGQPGPGAVALLCPALQSGPRFSV